MQHSLNDLGTPKDLALHRIDVAKEDLETAESNYSENHLRAANNRAYYAIYHAITAVLAIESVAFKKHKDTIAHFNKFYVKTEIFPRELGRRISVAQEIRHASDYDEFYLVTKEETRAGIESARELIKLVEIFLTNK